MGGGPVTQAPRSGCKRSTIRPIAASKPPQKLTGSLSARTSPAARPGTRTSTGTTDDVTATSEYGVWLSLGPSVETLWSGFESRWEEAA